MRLTRFEQMPGTRLAREAALAHAAGAPDAAAWNRGRIGGCAKG